MISPEQFLDFLEPRDLLSPKLLASLRRQLAEAQVPINAALLAKRLVDNGHLSHRLAQRLLEQAETHAQSAGASGRSRPLPAQELELAPLDEPASSRVPARSAGKAPAAPEANVLEGELAPLGGSRPAAGRRGQGVGRGSGPLGRARALGRAGSLG